MKRLPAEWEPQDAMLICWPHEKTNWAPYLNKAEAVLMDIAEAIARFEKLIVVVPDKECVHTKLAARGSSPARQSTMKLTGSRQTAPPNKKVPVTRRSSCRRKRRTPSSAMPPVKAATSRR